MASFGAELRTRAGQRSRANPNGFLARIVLIQAKNVFLNYSQKFSITKSCHTAQCEVLHARTFCGNEPSWYETAGSRRGRGCGQGVCASGVPVCAQGGGACSAWAEIPLSLKMECAAALYSFSCIMSVFGRAYCEDYKEQSHEDICNIKFWFRRHEPILLTRTRRAAEAPTLVQAAGP